MKRMMLSVAALAMMSGLAIAQDSPRDEMDNWMKDNGSRFFADEGMTTLRPEADLTTAFGALTPEEQEVMKNSCSKGDSPRWQGLCGAYMKSSTSQ